MTHEGKTLGKAPDALAAGSARTEDGAAELVIMETVVR
jgi:hypothetical protein